MNEDEKEYFYLTRDWINQNPNYTNDILCSYVRMRKSYKSGEETMEDAHDIYYWYVSKLINDDFEDDSEDKIPDEDDWGTI